MDSDATREWTFSREAKVYTERSTPKEGPSFPQILIPGLDQLQRAWTKRSGLEQDAAGFKSASMLPEATIDVEGKRYRCYVVHLTERDLLHPIPNCRAGEAVAKP